MQYSKPQGYECFGEQYVAYDAECRNCPFSNACRDTYISRSSVPAPYHSMTIPPPPPPPPTTMVPVTHIPAVPAPPPPPTNSLTYGPWRQMPQQAPPPPLTPAYYQQQPVVVQQPYHPQSFEDIFGVYPGEPVSHRFLKNTLLKGAVGFFSEVVRFFQCYSWPPSPPMA